MSLITESDINKFYDYAIIDIKNRYGKIVANAKVDLCDCDRVLGLHLCYIKNGYIQIVENKTSIGLHRFIIDADRGSFVDHINGDRSDNRKCNLRICTRQENGANRVDNRNNKSGHRGVLWYNKNNKWMAYITVNWKRKHLGYFNNLEDAINARLVAEEMYFKDFAPSDERKNIKYPNTNEWINKN